MVDDGGTDWVDGWVTRWAQQGTIQLLIAMNGEFSDLRVDQLESEPSAERSGEAYQAEISFIHIAGRMASAGLIECTTTPPQGTN